LLVTRSANPKKRHRQLHNEQRQLAALVQEIRVRVLNCSATGCLLESDKQVSVGTVAALHVSLGGGAFSDLVKVVRCEGFDRRGLYHVAAEFVSVTPADAGSLRHVTRCDSSEPAEWLMGDQPSNGTNVPCGADNAKDDAGGKVGESSEKLRIANVLTCSPGETTGRGSGNQLAELVTAAQPTAINQKRADWENSIMKNFIVSFVRDEQGQDLVEYALLAGLISIVCVGVISSSGNKISSVWSAVDSALGTIPAAGS
jgi:pilus assembly protein Flp/PilA